MAFYPSSKPEGNHAKSTHSHLLFIFKLKYFLESNNKKLYIIPYRSTQHKLEGYRHLQLHSLLQHPHIPSITM